MFTFFVYSSDGSDESACSVDEDPNAAPKCNQAECILPDCFCSADGTQSPGNLEITQVPQMITISFNGAVNQDNIPIYQDLFPEGTYYIADSIVQNMKKKLGKNMVHLSELALVTKKKY